MMTTKMRHDEAETKQGYVAPTIEVLGSLDELTLRGKEFGRPNDGDFLYSSSLSRVS